MTDKNLLRTLSSGLILGLLFPMLSCSNDGLYMQSIDGKWAKDTPLSFSFEVKDAEVPKNIIFVVRNNNDYPYSNIRVFSSVSEEGAKNVAVDTLNYIMAKPNGEWLGAGFGDTKEIKFLYKSQYKFPKNGKYIISVKQAMRNDNLPGIEDFGIEISSAE